MKKLEVANEVLKMTEDAEYLDYAEYIHDAENSLNRAIRNNEDLSATLRDFLRALKKNSDGDYYGDLKKAEIFLEKHVKL